MKWIDVKERLPTAGQRVLMSTQYFVGEGYVDHDGNWMRNGLSMSGFSDSKVTHWMPLPKTFFVQTDERHNDTFKAIDDALGEAYEENKIEDKMPYEVPMGLLHVETIDFQGLIEQLDALSDDELQEYLKEFEEEGGEE
jgi:hypothetical protein